MFLELNSKDCIKVQEKERKVFVSCVHDLDKREIRHFHVVVVQRQQRNVQKSMIRGQSCCLINLNLLLFSRSCCRRRRRCLSSLLLIFSTTATTTTIPLSATPALAAIIIIRTLRSEDCDGEENVALKVISRCFNLHGDYSNSYFVTCRRTLPELNS